MRSLVLTYGRGPVWAALIGGPIVVILLVCMVVDLVSRATSEPPFDPAVVLTNGGKTVLVSAYCTDDGERRPLSGGSFQVITHSGRKPIPAVGPLAGNIAQFVVEPNWIGQVRLTDRPDGERGKYEEFSNWVGEPYGWDAREVVGSC